MHHVVLLYLDERSENSISRLQRSLDDAGLPTPLRDRPGLRPHLTLASYPMVLDEAVLMDIVRRYAWARAPLGLRFESLAVFPGTGVLFLSPAPSLALLKDHEDLYDMVDRLELPGDAHYTPDSWTPHCTLGKGMTVKQLGTALDLVLGQLALPIVAKARSIGVVRVGDEPKDVRLLNEFAWGK